ncbi:MAG: SPOR domain-containing protein [Brevinema sp.]
MARIKFLDVLEETKGGSRFEQEQSYAQNDRDYGAVQNRYPIKERAYDQTELDQAPNYNATHAAPARESRRAPEYNPAPRESRFSFDGGAGAHRIPDSPMKSAPSLDLDDSRTLWTGALFVFFGGLLFISGYWFGKNVTDRVKEENAQVVQTSSKEFKRQELSTLNVAELPVVTPVAAADVLPVVEPALPVLPELPKKEVAKPAAAKKVAPKITPKPAPITKEYVIQVSTHSTMDAARRIEDSLRGSGFSAYISENIVGNVVYFRVRIRGFNTKTDAERILNDVKSTGFGAEGYVLTLD